MSERILVVDDDADMRRLMSTILRKAGYEVAEAASGSEALAMGPEIAADLVLLDVVMPGLDGFAVCSRFKNDSRTAEVPVIFLTGRGDAEDKIHGFETGGADYVTKPFDRGELLARVDSQLKIRRLTRAMTAANIELREKQRRLDEDLRAAAEIQRSLLPQNLPQIEGIDIAWRFEPSQVIGGDIFNVFRMDDRMLALYMVDVSGHGVPAALLTVSVSQSLQLQGDIVMGARRKPRSPLQVLERLNKEYPLERFDKYFTILYALLDTREGTLTYSSAGHPPPLLIRTDRSIRRLDRGGTIIGLGGMVPFEEGRETLDAGDLVLFYTDGVVEHQGAAGPYGMDRLSAFLAAESSLPPPSLMERLLSDLRGFGGDRTFQDDVSILALRFIGKTASGRESAHGI